MPGTWTVEGDEHRHSIWLQIRRVLMESWDPIGIIDEPAASNEYDSYIPKIVALLRAGSSIDAVMAYLDEIATCRMGFTSQRDLSRAAAERLLALDREFFK